MPPHPVVWPLGQSSPAAILPAQSWPAASCSRKSGMSSETQLPPSRPRRAWDGASVPAGRPCCPGPRLTPTLWAQVQRDREGGQKEAPAGPQSSSPPLPSPLLSFGRVSSSPNPKRSASFFSLKVGAGGLAGGGGWTGPASSSVPSERSSRSGNSPWKRSGQVSCQTRPQLSVT